MSDEISPLLGSVADVLPASCDILVTDPPYSSGGMTRGDRAKGGASKYALPGGAGSLRRRGPFAFLRIVSLFLLTTKATGVMVGLRNRDMSTTHFDAAELANIANALRLPYHDDQNEILATLAEFSEVNTQAFNKAYNEDAVAWTVDDLRAYCSPMRGNVPQACGTVGLMEYNCDGLMSDALAAKIGRFAVRLLRVQGERLGQAREQIEYLNGRLREEQAKSAPVVAPAKTRRTGAA